MDEMPGPVEWTGTAVNSGSLGFGLLFAATVGVVVYMVGLTIVGAVAAAVLIAALAITFSSVAVEVTDRDVRVLVGPWRLPVRRIARSRIQEVKAIEVSPARYGGYGYRMAAFWPPRWAVVVRKGPALLINSERGMPLVVTVDDATRGAEILKGRSASHPG